MTKNVIFYVKECGIYTKIILRHYLLYGKLVSFKCLIKSSQNIIIDFIIRLLLVIFRNQKVNSIFIIIDYFTKFIKAISY